MNNLHMIDISDPTDPQLVAEFPYPEVPRELSLAQLQHRRKWTAPRAPSAPTTSTSP